jgi:pimeloyl-ACP methyl ester carboxylesterase
MGSSGFDELDRMEDLVFHYLDLLEVLGFERPILVGASLGGWLATEFAIRYAGMLRALILVDALGLRVPGAPTADVFQLDVQQTRAALFADATAALAHDLVPDTPARESIEAMLKARQVLARLAWQFPDNPRLASYLYRVNCPTLIVWGERDGVVPVSHGHVYQRAIVDAALAVLPACGHLPHVEQPEAVANTVLNYLERRNARV